MPAILVKRVSNKRYRTLDTTSGQAPESELQCHSRNLGHRRCWNGVLSWALERLEPHSSLRDGRHMHTWSHLWMGNVLGWHCPISVDGLCIMVLMSYELRGNENGWSGTGKANYSTIRTLTMHAACVVPSITYHTS